MINSNEDILEMIRHWLEIRGFNGVVTGHIRDIRTGLTDFVIIRKPCDREELVAIVERAIG